MKLLQGGKNIGKTVICTPILDGNVTVEYMISLLETMGHCMRAGIEMDVAFIRGDCFIAKARNNLIVQFLERKGENLFFIDCDQGWSAQAFMNMLHDKREFVAAAVPKKIDQVTFNNVDLVIDDKANCTVESNMLKTNSVGTGFMRLKKSMIDKMIKAYPETYRPGDGGTQALHPLLFETKIIDGQFWGEDMVFCKKWTDIGGEIWIEPNVNIKHVGRKTWEGNFLQFLQANCDVNMAKAA